jgi:hypothetical protein
MVALQVDLKFRFGTLTAWCFLLGYTDLRLFVARPIRLTELEESH